MRTLTHTIVIVLAVGAGILAPLGCAASEGQAPVVKPPGVTDQDVAAAAKSNNAFAADLYGALREQEGNLFLSPFSISTALAMTYAGARGETAEQMADVLHFDAEGKVHRQFGGLGHSVRAREDAGYQLDVANALWVQEDYDLLETFLDTVTQNYGAGVRQVDYKGDTEGARKTINGWVEEQTRDKIRDLLQPGVLDHLTRLVLTNAVYFKGVWKVQFDPKATTDAPFQVTPDDSVTVPMMYQEDDFWYGEDEGVQVLGMPYAGDALSMIVLLPKAKDGLPALEQKLTAAQMEQWVSSMHPRKVRVYLPRFKATSQFGLGPMLAGLGMPLAFDARDADFSGMTGRPDLYISAVIHKAFVDVNEEGTEAAAATAVVMRVKSAMPAEPPTFRADHPFLFLIRDTESGAILFLGRMANPL